MAVIAVVATAVAFPYPRQQNMRGVLVRPLHCSFAPQFRRLVHCFSSSVQITATTPVAVVAAVGVGFFFGRVFNVVHDHQQRGGDLVLLFVVNELFGLVVVNDCVVCVVCLFVCSFVCLFVCC